MYNRRFVAKSKLSEIIHYVTCGLWPLILIEDQKQNNCHSKQLVFLQIPNKILYNENGSERCFLRDYTDDDSDIENNEDKMFESFHEQKKKEIQQLINTNPAYINDPIVLNANNELIEEEEGIKRAKIYNAVGETTLQKAIKEKYMHNANLNYYTLYKKKNGDASKPPAAVLPSRKQKSIETNRKILENISSSSSSASEKEVDEKETDKPELQALCI